jgi:hypothetical protein
MLVSLYWNSKNHRFVEIKVSFYNVSSTQRASGFNLELFAVSLLYYSLQFYAFHIHEMCAVTLNFCVSKICWIYFQMRSKLPVCFTLLKWLTLITLDKDCRLRSFSLWHCLHPTVTSSLINLKYLYILFCNNVDLCSSLNRNRNYNYTSCRLWFVSGYWTRTRRILHEC